MSTSSQAQPTFFVVTKKDNTDLATPLVKIGEGNDEEAAIVFTEHARADEYVQQAGWADTDTVAELDAAGFVKWLGHLQNGNVKFLVPDPDRIHQGHGIRQSVVTIASIAEAICDVICERLATVETTSQTS